MTDHFIGVDVGTGSARAGVFDAQGTLLMSAKHDIDMHRAPNGVAEQSSAQVWDAVCQATRKAVADAAIDPASVRGIGFDATCSMVVRGRDGSRSPLAILPIPSATSSCGWIIAPLIRPNALMPISTKC